MLHGACREGQGLLRARPEMGRVDLLPLEAAREQILLARPLATRLGSKPLAPLEATAERLGGGIGLRRIEELHEQGTPRSEQPGSERRNRFEQRLFARPVGRANARELRCGIAEEDLGRTSELGKNSFDHGLLREIAGNCDHVRKIERRLDRGEIDPHHPARRAYRSGRHLEPAPRPAAEVDHALPAREQAMLRLDLEQLVGRAGSVALALGALVEGVLAVVVGDQTAGRTRTRPWLWPGTAPRTKSRFFAGSTLITTRFRVVTRSLP